MSNPRPVCVKCQREMRIDKCGVNVILMAYEPPQPFEIWRGDRWKCPKCGAEVVARYGDRAIAMHFEPTFDEELAKLRESFTTYEVYER